MHIEAIFQKKFENRVDIKIELFKNIFFQKLNFEPQIKISPVDQLIMK